MGNKRKSFNDRVAKLLTDVAGAMPFFWVLVLFYSLWISWNALCESKYQFDSSGYPMLLFISNFIQLLFLPIIQVGQNQVQKTQMKLEKHIDSQVGKIKELSEDIQKLLKLHHEYEVENDKKKE